MDQPIASANWRTVTIRMSSYPSSTSKSLSPVTTHPQPAATASAKTSSSSASRQTTGIGSVGCTNFVLRRAYLVSRAACRGVVLNLSGSFSLISSRIHSPEYTSFPARKRRQKRRHTPRRVSTASQTLVSSRTFTLGSQTRQRENLILGHRAVDRERIRPSEEGVIVLLHEPAKHLRPVVCGQLLEFFDHLSCGHDRKLAAGSGFSSLLTP